MPRTGGRRIPANMVIDLTPVLSVIIHLIPMLLVLVRFQQLAQIAMQEPLIPSMAPPSTAAAAAQSERVVSVSITEEGYVVGGFGDNAPVIRCQGTCGPGTYDTAALTEALKGARRAHPDEPRVVIAPAARVPWEVVVATMDASRTYDSGGKPAPLFPQAILAMPAPTGGAP